MNTIIILSILAPVVCYLVIGLSARSKVKTVDEYYIYGQQVDARDYANTSVGYSLQMAAIFLFAYWAILYGLGALWTVLFWFAGYWVLKKLLPRFLAFHRARTTMHGYVSDQFGGGQELRFLAAIATIIGLWGTMMAEIDYTVQVLAPQWPGLFIQFLIGAGFLLFGVWYILRNGYKAEVNTERIQVPIAYAALFAVLIALLPAVWQNAGETTFKIVAVLLATCLSFIIAARLRHRAINGMHLDDVVPIIALVALATVYWATVNWLPVGHVSTVLDTPIRTQLHAQGWVGIISLLIANALWMPVDFSTWQRVASVKGDDDKAVLSLLDRGTWRVMLESPATWVMGIVLGLEIQAGGFLPAGSDPNNGIAIFATSLAHNAVGGVWTSLNTWLYPLFIIASISIMMSTVHGIVSAISYAAWKDMHLKKGGLQDVAEDKNLPLKARLKKPRLITGLIMLSGLVFYPLLRWKVGANLPTLLYGAYSMQLSLLVVVLLSLFQRNLRPRAALASILTGFAFTCISVWAAVNIPDPDAAVLPPIFAVFGAGIGYVLAYKWGWKNPQAVEVA